jgi:glycosyltransferase involved in cell wall biosynthesis
MKILMICHASPYPTESGATKRIFHLLQQTASRHEVSLIAIGTPEQESRFREHAGVPCRRTRFVSVKRSRARLGWRLVWNLVRGRSTAWLLHSAEVQRTIDAFASEERFDLVHCSLALLGLYRLPAGTPLVADTQNVEYDAMRRSYEETRPGIRKLFFYLNYRFMKREEIAFASRFHALFATSERDGAIFRQDMPDLPVTVVPNGVDLRFFRPMKGERDRGMLIFTGIMNYYPNEHGILYFLDHVLPLILRRAPHTVVQIVGAHPSKELQKRAGRNVIVTGRVEDVRPYIARSEVFIIPLLIGGGTRLKALEAMAMKVPIVSTTLGCEGIEFAEPDSVVFGDSPVEFSEAVLRLLSDPDRRNQLAERSSRTAERYSWESIGMTLDSAHRAIAARVGHDLSS